MTVTVRIGSALKTLQVGRQEVDRSIAFLRDAGVEVEFIDLSVMEQS